MAGWHYEIDQMRIISRGDKPFLYYRVSYWRQEQDRIDGKPPVVINDFKNGDLLRWPGQTKIQKRWRYNPGTDVPEFYCGTHDHWVAGANKYEMRDVSGELHEVRVHHPERLAVGKYEWDEVPGWIHNQAEDWIALHPDATGDRTDGTLFAQGTTGGMNVALRKMSKRRNVVDAQRKYRSTGWTQVTE